MRVGIHEGFPPAFIILIYSPCQLIQYMGCDGICRLQWALLETENNEKNYGYLPIGCQNATSLNKKNFGQTWPKVLFNYPSLTFPAVQTPANPLAHI